MAQVYDKRGTHKKKFFVFQQRGNGILKGSVKGCATYNRMVNEMITDQPSDTFGVADVVYWNDADGAGQFNSNSLLLKLGKTVSSLVQASE